MTALGDSSRTTRPGNCQGEGSNRKGNGYILCPPPKAGTKNPGRASSLAEDLRPAERATPMSKPDYAYPKIEDYEECLGRNVTEEFRRGWVSARVTNNDLRAMSNRGMARQFGNSKKGTSRNAQAQTSEA